MTDDNWIPPSRELPPKGVVVSTMDSGGNVQDLLFDKLWWFPDHSMYVYYTPQFWKAKEEQA